MSHVPYAWVILHRFSAGNKSDIAFVHDFCHIRVKSCHVWMSHVTYEWVMSRMNESCHVWMSHVTYEWVMSRMNESCHILISHVPYAWVVQKAKASWLCSMGHVKYASNYVTYESVMSCMNESCSLWMSHFTLAWFMSHRFFLQEAKASLLAAMIYVTYASSHVTYEWVMSHMNESCHVRGISHIWMSDITYGCVVSRTNDLCHICIKTCHIWMSHVMNESYHTYEWVLSRIIESCHTWMNRFIYEWFMSHRFCAGSKGVIALVHDSCHICIKSCHVWMSHVMQYRVAQTHRIPDF